MCGDAAMVKGATILPPLLLKYIPDIYQQDLNEQHHATPQIAATFALSCFPILFLPTACFPSFPSSRPSLSFLLPSPHFSNASIRLLYANLLSAFPIFG